MQEHTFYVLDPKLINHGLGEATAVEGSSEDFVEFGVEAADAEFLEVHILFEHLLLVSSIRLNAHLLLIFSRANNIRSVQRLKHSIRQSRLDIDGRYFFNVANEDAFLVPDGEGKLLAVVYHVAFE